MNDPCITTPFMLQLSQGIAKKCQKSEAIQNCCQLHQLPWIPHTHFNLMSFVLSKQQHAKAKGIVKGRGFK